MKNIKDLAPHQICIRATEENAEFIIPLLEKLGGVKPVLRDIKMLIDSYFMITIMDNYIVWNSDEKGRTEITLEQLRELAGEVKEPQTDELWRVETKRHPLGETGDYENVVTLFYGKEKIHFPEDTEVDIVEEIAEGLNEVSKLKSENESLKKERDELKSALKEMRKQVLVLIAGLDGQTDADREEYGESYPEMPFITTAKEFIKQFDSKPF